MDQNTQKLGSKMKAVQEHQDGRFKKKEIELISRHAWGKRKDVTKNVIEHHVKVILILLLKNIFHQKIFRHSGIAVNLQLLSSIYLFYHQPVVLPEVSKLNGAVMNKNHRDQTQFSPHKKPLKKENGFAIICIFTICYDADKQI